MNDNPAARDLADLLPLTVDLKDFHGTERIGCPPRKLNTAGAPEPTAAKAGDLACYAPWGNLALFHRDGPAADANLLILGHIDADPDRRRPRTEPALPKSASHSPCWERPT
ncbi:cyclophilin-like fold protein [Streptomyces atratus]|uniref:cyclophilin-like fold protein n=1 Tax=Streptomyces atratus TaxID=1893 RepID=UPI00340D6E64